jgi:hypothetical protein
LKKNEKILRIAASLPGNKIGKKRYYGKQNYYRNYVYNSGQRFGIAARSGLDSFNFGVFRRGGGGGRIAAQGAAVQEHFIGA